MGHFAIRMGLMVRAAEAALRPAVRGVDEGYLTPRTSTGQTAAAPWCSRAGVHPVSGAPLGGALGAGPRRRVRTTKSALKWRAVKRTSKRF